MARLRYINSFSIQICKIIRHNKPYCTVYCTGTIGASGSNAGVNNALPAIFSKDHIIYGVTFEFYIRPFHFRKYLIIISNLARHNILKSDWFFGWIIKCPTKDADTATIFLMCGWERCCTIPNFSYGQLAALSATFGRNISDLFDLILHWVTKVKCPRGWVKKSKVLSLEAIS